MKEKQIIRNLLRRILLEKDGDKYDYGCVMLEVGLANNKWDSIQSLIKEEDVYKEEGDQTYGRENAPHITMLYGLHDDVKPKSVEEIIKNTNKIDVELKKITIFEQDKYDVVKFDIIGDSKKELSNVNKELKKLPHTSAFPDYHPHCTIAYVKKGKGKDYIQTLSKDESIVINCDTVLYSDADNKEVKYKLK